ncbi:MAG: fused response regulator/phosphatase [Gammaproteobacteria bacterium]|nr:fused response regulator/phosphatase [Gammaproteobacteria bacterium]
MSAIEPMPVKCLRLISLLKPEQRDHHMQRALDLLQFEKCDISSISRERGVATTVDHVSCQDFAMLQSELQVLPDALPNLLLLSVALLGENVSAALAALREAFQERYIPIVIVGEESDAAQIGNAMESGANDFVMLPTDPKLIKSKLQAQLKVGSMHAIMSQQHREISNNHQHILREQQMAKEVFNKVAHDSAELANVRHWLSPIAVFNGDILLATPTPSGSLLVLMGDFTGHGLGAAIGTIPLASTFYGMASKGFAMYDIITELNSKLHALLPTGVFCCACVAQINFQDGVAEVWNAGLPDCYILRQNSELLEINSSALALGIMGSDAFAIESKRYNLEQGDRIYLLSDGLLETENTAGEQYGELRLQKALTSTTQNHVQAPAQSAAGLESIKQDVLEFIGEHCRADDISLVEIEMVSAEQFESFYDKTTKHKVQQPVSWSLQYEFRAESLRHQDPVPLVLHSLLEEPNLRQYSGQLFSIISELYNNALDHGLLQLSSSIKQQEQGFARYYDMRQRRLQELDSGNVRFELDYRATSDSGALTVEVIDSGPGFDYKAKQSADKGGDVLHGRGIALLRTICRKVEYQGSGNHVRVEYGW